MSILKQLQDWSSHRRLRHLQNDENLRFMRQHELFKGMSAAALVYLHECLFERRYKRHEVIFEEGTPGVCIFIVKAGRVQIYSDGSSDDGQPPPSTVYAEVQRGRIFGELSVLALGSHSTSARAMGQGCVLLTLTSQAFDELLDLYPRDAVLLLRGITEVIAQNLKRANERLQHLEETVRRFQDKETAIHE